MRNFTNVLQLRRIHRNSLHCLRNTILGVAFAMRSSAIPCPAIPLPLFARPDFAIAPQYHASPMLNHSNPCLCLTQLRNALPLQIVTVSYISVSDDAVPNSPSVNVSLALIVFIIVLSFFFFLFTFLCHSFSTPLLDSTSLCPCSAVLYFALPSQYSANLRLYSAVAIRFDALPSLDFPAYLRYNIGIVV